MASRGIWCKRSFRHFQRGNAPGAGGLPAKEKRSVKEGSAVGAERGWPEDVLRAPGEERGRALEWRALVPVRRELSRIDDLRRFDRDRRICVEIPVPQSGVARVILSCLPDGEQRLFLRKRARPGFVIGLRGDANVRKRTTIRFDMMK
jgi:hypothetical protein